jgi:signal transduction histidine kinase
MGTLFRLLVFIIALGVLGTGTAWLLARERQREATRERLLTAAAEMDFGSRVAALQRQQTAAEFDLLLFGALAVSCLLIVTVVPARATASPTPSGAGGNPLPLQREMAGLESLARTTVTQRAELDRERDSRHRTQQDLYLQQVLTNQALQDKIRLGRDLHDGLVQSLYATGLMLESATQLVASNPVEASRILTGVKSNLKTAIRDTRSVIGGLTPDEIESRSLADSIQALIDHLDGGRQVQREITLSPDVPALDESTVTELLQIIRESVSNALRHGAATRLVIHLAPSTTTLDLMIRDNGRGFTPDSATRGHGLDNLSARARLLDGTLTVTSHPGEGACVHLSIPLPSAT